MVLVHGALARRLQAPTAEDLLSVAPWRGGFVAVGTRGMVMTVDAQGKVAVQPPITARTLRGVASLNDKMILAVGDRGAAMRWNGSAWRLERLPAEEDLLGAWLSAELEVVVGAAGTILQRQGERWGKAESPTSQTLVAVWGSSPNEIFAVSGEGGVVEFDGRRWTPSRSPAACLKDVSGALAGPVFAVGCHGTILRLDRSNGQPRREQRE
jgi:photosystem II stability/assembly factor-like uncharacterized protein